MSEKNEIKSNSDSPIEFGQPLAKMISIEITRGIELAPMQPIASSGSNQSTGNGQTASNSGSQGNSNSSAADTKK